MRISRISTISDRLADDAEVIVDRLAEATTLRRALDELMAGLSEASEAVVREARAGTDELPSL